MGKCSVYPCQKCPLRTTYTEYYAGGVWCYVTIQHPFYIEHCTQTKHTRNYVTRMKFLNLQCHDDVKCDWLLKEDCAGSGIWWVQVRGYCVGWFWRQDHIHRHALAFRTQMFMSRASVFLSSNLQCSRARANWLLHWDQGENRKNPFNPQNWLKMCGFWVLCSQIFNKI